MVNTFMRGFELKVRSSNDEAYSSHTSFPSEPIENNEEERKGQRNSAVQSSYTRWPPAQPRRHACTCRSAARPGTGERSRAGQGRGSSGQSFKYPHFLATFSIYLLVHCEFNKERFLRIKNGFLGLCGTFALSKQARTKHVPTKARFPQLSRVQPSFFPERARGRSAGSLFRISGW